MDINEINKLFLSMGSPQIKQFVESQHPRAADGEFASAAESKKPEAAANPESAKAVQEAGSDLDGYVAPTADFLSGPIEIPKDIWDDGLGNDVTASQAMIYGANKDGRFNASTASHGAAPAVTATIMGGLSGFGGNMLSNYVGSRSAEAMDKLNNYGERAEEANRHNPVFGRAQPLTEGGALVRQLAPGVVQATYVTRPGTAPNVGEDARRLTVVTGTGVYRGQAYADKYPATKGWEFQATNIVHIDVPKSGMSTFTDNIDHDALVAALPGTFK